MPITDERYRAKRVHRGRGIDEFDRRIGGIRAEIDARLASREVVRVLELGCGYGTALLELRARYGARVALTGVNRAPGDGDRAILLRNASDRGLPIDDRAPERALPRLAYADVAKGLPFADDAFDVVASQVAWIYFGDKINVAREIVRVLAPDGIAKIDADEIDPKLPPEYARLLEIWQDGQLVPFGDYLRRFGVGFEKAVEGTYFTLRKCAGFGDGLTLVAEIDASRLGRHFDGVKCVYAFT